MSRDLSVDRHSDVHTPLVLNRECTKGACGCGTAAVPYPFTRKIAETDILSPVIAPTQSFGAAKLKPITMVNVTVDNFLAVSPVDRW